MSTQILAPTVIPSSPVISPYVYSAAYTYSLDMVVQATIFNDGTPNIPCRTLIQLTTDGINWTTMSDARKANGGYNATTSASFSLDAYARLGSWTQFRIGFGAGQGAGCTVSAVADGVPFASGGGGSGTVNPGSTDQIASYPSAGPSVSGIGLAGTLAISGGNLGVAPRSIGPSQLATGTAETLLGFDGSGNPGAIAAGANVTISGGTIAAGGGGGSGTVSSGTTNQIAGYTGSGSTVGGLTIAGGNAAVSGGNLQINTATVATYTDLYAIPVALRTPLMIVGVQSDGSYWAWNGGTTLTSTDWTQAGPMQFLLNGTVISNRGALNVITGAGIVLTMTDDPTNDRTNLTIAAGSGGTWSLVQGATNSAGGTTATFGSAVTAGNTVIAYVASVGTSTVAAGEGAMTTLASDGSGYPILMAARVATAGGGGYTITGSGSSFYAIGIEEWHYTGPSWTASTPATADGTSAAPDPGAVTFTGIGLLLGMASIALGSASPYTPASGFTSGFMIPFNSGVNVGLLTQYRATSTSPQDAAFSMGSGSGWTAAAIALQGA